MIVWLRVRRKAHVAARIEGHRPDNRLIVRTADDRVLVVAPSRVKASHAHLLPTPEVFEARAALACRRELAAIQAEARSRAHAHAAVASPGRNPPKLTADERAEMREKRA